MLRAVDTLPLVCDESDHSAVPPYSRVMERSGGFSVQKRFNSGDRVDLNPASGRFNFCSNEQSLDRPVRDFSKQETSNFCLSLPGRPSVRDRRSIHSVGQSVRVRFSTVSSPSKGFEEGEREQELRNITHSSSVASATMVSGSVVSSGRFSNTSSRGPADSVASSCQGISSDARSVQSSRVEDIRRRLSSQGFSEAAAVRISAPQRSSTRSIYDSKWRIFSCWCTERDSDPFSASPQIVANFLTYLFEEKGLSPETLKGYRSAISSTRKHLGGLNLGQDTRISDLLRNLELERPRSLNVIPKWDIKFVLHCLKSLPFEPLSTISMSTLSHKTAFLLALASSKRRSELHAISLSSVEFNSDFSEVRLDTFPGFLAKNQLPSEIRDPVVIPALKDFKSLCPVRTLRCYIARSALFRKGRKRLFIPFAPSAVKEISAPSISRWIVSCIKTAYSTSVNDTTLLSLKINAHEVRAIASSLAYFNRVPLDKVLDAAFWKTSSTFARFYLRDFHQDSSVSAVAAQSVIGPNI